MVSEKYKAYLRSPAWKRKREAALNYYGRKCYACGTRRGPLHIHHLTYERFTREALRDLRPLCQPCHRAVTRLHWKMGKRRVTGAVVLAAYMRMNKMQQAELRKR